MIEETDFETYLYISKDKFQIFTYDKLSKKNLYDEELKLAHYFDFNDMSILSKFLDQNIFKIEKLVKNFVKNIILIIENKKILHVNIAVKKKNYDNSLNEKYLENTLTELKDLFKENYQDHSIMHMTIVNYILNDKKNTLLNKDLANDNLCIEVNFISISNDLLIVFDKLLEKYQIEVTQRLCGNYISDFFEDNSDQLSLMAYKIRNGFNKNEVMLVPKNIENKGFFEKFFQLFS